jgi:hypothetical protein
LNPRKIGKKRRIAKNFTGFVVSPTEKTRILIEAADFSPARRVELREPLLKAIES